MKDKLLELTGRFDALSLRERSTIGTAVLLGGLMMGYLVLVDPQITRQATQHKRITQLKGEMAAQEAQMVALKSQLKDPDAANRAALQEVRKSMAAIDQRLRNVQDSLVPPEKMQAFLEGLMTKDQGLELVALRTLSVAPLIKSTPAPGKPSADDKTAKEHAEPAGGKKPAAPAGAAGAGDTASNLYKHSIEMRVAGSYNDLARYLAALEGMPQRIIWEKAELTVEKHPRCVLILTVYTLSLDKRWLTV